MNVSSNLLKLCHKDLRQFWMQKVIQPSTGVANDVDAGIK